MTSSQESVTEEKPSAASRANTSPGASLRDGLVFGTANRKKTIELADQFGELGIPLLTLADFPAAINVDETGDSFTANAQLKAGQQAQRLGEWVLGEDSGLVVDALGGAPGIYSARFSGPGATDASNNALLLEKLQGVGVYPWNIRPA